MPRGRPIEEDPCRYRSRSPPLAPGEGKTLRAYCRQEGKPSYRAIYRWLDKDEEFSSRVAQARDLGEDVIAQECLAIADDESKDVYGELELPNNVAVNRAKLRIETRLKLLAKWNPKKYGDKIMHQGDESQPLVVRHIGKSE